MTVNVNGITLFYEKAGTGHPLLLLHGNGEDHHIFDALAPRLFSRHTVYALDSRNHGRSGRSDNFSYEVMAEDTLGLVRALGLERPHIVGFSDGAIIALVMAMRAGGELGGLALLGPNLSPADFKDECRAEIETEYARTGDPLLRLMLEEPNLSPRDLAALENNTLVIGGEDDIFRPDTFKTIAGAIPDARLLILAGHTHDSYIAGSDLLYELFAAFFRSSAG